MFLTGVYIFVKKTYSNGNGVGGGGFQKINVAFQAPSAHMLT
jgi:hypothetical protein